MNIQEALDLADQMRPNMMSRQVKIAFLQQLDQIIYNEILLKHRHTPEEEVLPEYESDDTGSTELLVPDPYGTEMYPYWLMSKIDSMNMEYDKYNNDRAMFENAYDSMSDWWTRTKMPLQAMPFVRI